MEENIILTKHINKINPMAIDDYIKVNGYEALKKVLKDDPLNIIKEIKESALRGRGGAAFNTGIKMESVYNEKETDKYVICNADEGEPGNFKDRYLMENNPHQLIEGIIIAGYAVGSTKAHIYIRGEYDKSKNILMHALKEAKERGFLGSNIIGSNFNYEIEIFSGMGSYVCGEETALIESIEGKVGRPRIKPPFPTVKGLFDKPTLLNNVETLSNIPYIVLNGGSKYASIGTESSKGTMLISLSGNVKRSGVFEVPFGTSIKYIIGVLGETTFEKIKMIQLGGPSGPIIPLEMVDLKIDIDAMRKSNLSIGSGAIIVIDNHFNMFEILRKNIRFFEHESCGKCTPCREGIRQIRYILSLFVNNLANQSDLAMLEELTHYISETSFCGLGQAATNSVASTLKYFRSEYEMRIKK